MKATRKSDAASSATESLDVRFDVGAIDYCEACQYGHCPDVCGMDPGRSTRPAYCQRSHRAPQSVRQQQNRKYQIQEWLRIF